MPDNRICAVVVTFHPRDKDIENLRNLRLQVQHLVVVDNGSPLTRLHLLRDASKADDFFLIENASNVGIAAALNTGVRWAMEHRQEWVALFDQDSAITDGFMDAILSDYQLESSQRKIAQMIPRYLDPDSGREEYVPRAADGGPFITRTSGSFFPVETFTTCGLFTEELFIYCVDDDYSLRLRSMGFSIAESKHAVLLHRAGKPTPVVLFGRSFLTRNYRPEVQYYWARNRVWMVRKYGRKYPTLIYSSMRSLVGIPLKIMVAEQNRWPKVRMFTKGILDGLLGRTGQRVDIH